MSVIEKMDHFFLFLEERVNQITDDSQKIHLPVSNMNITYREDVYAELSERYPMSEEEQLFLFLLLLPLYHPEKMDVFTHELLRSHVSASLIGGCYQPPSRVFQPTFRTFLFLMGRNDQELYKMIAPDHYFIRNGIVRLGEVPPGGLLTDVPLSFTEEYYHRFTSGDYEPRMSAEFPAQKLSSTIEWKDLILSPRTQEHLNDLRIMIRQYDSLCKLPFAGRRMVKGIKALLYGEPGTGKTESVAILGAELNRPVYRVNISTVVSKYVGETEKNMENLFNMAEGRNWILFFDEADALFGKRSRVDSSQDRFANQQVSYLLQRVETYNGILLLATNKYLDMDEAFSRRLQFKIEYPKPNEEERTRLWKKFFENSEIPLQEDINFADLTWREITGGMLKNIFAYTLSKVRERGGAFILQEDLEKALYEEYYKERKEWKKERPKVIPNPVIVKGREN